MTPAQLLQSCSAQHLKNKSFIVIVIVFIIHNIVTCVNNTILIDLVIVHIFAKIMNKSLLLSTSRIGFIHDFHLHHLRHRCHHNNFSGHDNSLHWCQNHEQTSSTFAEIKRSLGSRFLFSAAQDRTFSTPTFVCTCSAYLDNQLFCILTTKMSYKKVRTHSPLFFFGLFVSQLVIYNNMGHLQITSSCHQVPRLLV